ncbi:hypothetical protein P3T36_005225 [Kitasatospora sp. MAP12-15]|uniref:hypothetical protein n=1 Tax=unclassified Kitasatospora TaxID=2633591 RepID=UPI002473353F|nr:hypothetical protein [Kitasatospora sp. MAP12-44]MDH6113612.1 hypothetical protein [Kitasatospora sp. MAP12-44]
MSTYTAAAAAAEPAYAAGDRPRHQVLLAPVTVTPSKPLTPSHLKGLLWTDAMYRATAQLADVTYRYSHTTYDRTEQTLGFWEYLDRTADCLDYSTLSEEQIGELYVGYRAEGSRPSAAQLHPYAEAVEHHGWVHPASARILELWTSHYARLGMHDPGLLAHQPPPGGLDEVIALLSVRNLCLDLRESGGPVYLDGTRYGLPLRLIVSSDGQPNYLACALRELVPLAPDFDEVVLLYDSELEPDYILLQRILGELGPEVRRVTLGRVPIDGRIRSARHGGWHDHTAGAVLAEAGADHDQDAVRLGLRLYFIATLGPGAGQSFRRDLLHQCCTKAARLIEAARATAPAPVADTIARHRGNHLFVDPYRLTSSLLGRRSPAPTAELLSAVYLSTSRP